MNRFLFSFVYIFGGISSIAWLVLTAQQSPLSHIAFAFWAFCFLMLYLENRHFEKLKKSFEVKVDEP